MFACRFQMNELVSFRFSYFVTPRGLVNVSTRLMDI